MHLVEFFHRLWNPHCAHCEEKDRLLMERDLEKNELNKICSTCEVLKQQLDASNAERHRLIETITRVPEVPVEREPVKMSMPKHLPWEVRRRMLEKEDREKARLMREAPKPSDVDPVSDKETELLEQEIANAQGIREAAR